MPPLYTEVIRTSSGQIANLSGHIIQEKYKVRELISDSGLSSYVFRVEDLNKAHTGKAKNLAIKMNCEP